jgi:hypothetical protein
VFREETAVLPHDGDNIPLNLTHVERMVKLLLWMKGGSEILVAGHEELAASSRRLRARGPAPSTVMWSAAASTETRWPSAASRSSRRRRRDDLRALGRNLDGCRIGFDLGGSDRKSAAVIDGEVVHAEEVEWNPYFESDPGYHFAGIMDSLARAAAHLPRVDAIGGSAAGVYVDNEPRVASLFRGIKDADFEAHIRPLFKRVRRAWHDVPFEVVNDGEVTALAASMSLDANRLLGISMGTSQAAGYRDAGRAHHQPLNELAFVPVDYRAGRARRRVVRRHRLRRQYFSQ